MPKNKRDDSSASGSASGSDSGSEEKAPAKKSKSRKSDKKQKKEDENIWQLGKNRQVSLTEFKGKWYVDVREFYGVEGDLKPSKKGIMLTLDQWQKFKSHIDEIDESIKQKV